MPTYVKTDIACPVCGKKPVERSCKHCGCLGSITDCDHTERRSGFISDTNVCYACAILASGLDG